MVNCDEQGVLHSWGHSVVHFSGLLLLARALATGETTVILQVFRTMVLHLHPPANKLRASIKNPLKWVKNCFPPNRKMRPDELRQCSEQGLSRSASNLDAFGWFEG